MTDALQLAGLLVFPGDREDPGRVWSCLPARPSLQRSAAGAPAVTVIDAAGLGAITLTGQLVLSADALVAARRLLAERAGLPPAYLSLVPATIVGAAAQLLLSGVDGQVPIAHSETSGYWPYHAALHAPLNPQQLADVRSGLAGTRDLLLLRYTVRIQHLTAEGVSTSQLAIEADAADWLAAGSHDAPPDPATPSHD